MQSTTTRHLPQGERDRLFNEEREPLSRVLDEWSWRTVVRCGARMLVDDDESVKAERGDDFQFDRREANHATV